MSPQKVSYIKITLPNVSENNKIQYWGVHDNEVVTSEISVLGSGDEEWSVLKYYH